MFDNYTKSKKLELLDSISDKFFNRNFGLMSKSDIEIFLFSEMLKYLRLEEPEKLSDYEISKILGITQSKVRNLKIKSELVYPREDFEKIWKELFKGYVKNIKYDDKDGLIKLNIPDVAVLTELRNFLEENGWYDEYQLNPKLFQCKLDIFVLVLEKLGGKDLILDRATATQVEKAMNGELTAEESNVLELFVAGDRKNAIKKLGRKLSRNFLNVLFKTVPGGELFTLLAEAVLDK